MSEKEFLEIMEALEAEGLVRAEENPAYGRCTCSCHDPNPFMMTSHCIPCCYPVDDDMWPKLEET